MDTTAKGAEISFSEREIAYLRTQRLARIATVSEELQPDVAPVGFEFDGRYFYVGGLTLSRTFKFKNVRKNSKVSLVVDDLESVNPWRPRGIKIHGIADVVDREGYVGSGAYIRIKPERKWGWGVEEPVILEGKHVTKKTKA